MSIKILTELSDLIRLLVTNAETRKSVIGDRSVLFGDADQSIYSFRLADFTILLDFQQDFGDGLPDEDTRTMVKLEETTAPGKTFSKRLTS